jgi:hypothetical protein
MIDQKLLLNELKSEWPGHYSLQPKNKIQRAEVIYIQGLKKAAAKEIERLNAMLNRGVKY